MEKHPLCWASGSRRHAEQRRRRRRPRLWLPCTRSAESAASPSALISAAALPRLGRSAQPPGPGQFGLSLAHRRSSFRLAAAEASLASRSELRTSGC
eukprot:6989369-Alexandrium_andersonii.AAC.1